MRILLVVAVIITLTGVSSFAIIHTSGKLNNVSEINDSLEADRMKYMNEVMESIRGKEKLPADSVFKNIEVIKGKSSVSAEHLLWMMNWGWSAELGVSCAHCHVIGKWESDSLSTKEIARGMWNMRI